MRDLNRMSAWYRQADEHRRDTVRVDEMAVPTSPFGVPGR